MGCNQRKRSMKNEKEYEFNVLSPLYRAHSDTVCPILSAVAILWLTSLILTMIKEIGRSMSSHKV